MSEERVGTNRRPTLEDVAARAGVSRALVSIVMRDVPGASTVTRERVRAVASELGYRPDGRARLLAGRRTGLLGVTLALHNPFHADVVDHLYAAAEQDGYQIVLSAVTGSRSAVAAIETLVSYRCEALIALETPRRHAALAEFAARQPFVVIGQGVAAGRGTAAGAAGGVDVVRVDDAAGLHLAVAHLTGLGHRRIAYVDGGRAPGAAARRAGYRAAMRAAGLAGEIHVEAGGEREEDGADAALRMITALPDAVITYNDRCAVGLLDVFARRGLDVPGRISVVGFDDTRQAALPYLALTTISQDTARLAALAVRRAVDRLAGPSAGPSAGLSTDAAPDHRETLVAPHLVVRGTTAKRTTRRAARSGR